MWLALQMPVQFGKRWQWHNDAGYRTLGNQVAAHQHLYRTGARYFLTPRLSTAAGIAFFFTRTSYAKQNKEFEREFRIWQEANWQPVLAKRLKGLLRLRTEQRFFEATGQQSARNTTRLRYRLGTLYELSPRWSVQLTDEYMHQFNHGASSFNQNRLNAMAIYQINDATQLQGGYTWLLWPITSQHIILLTYSKTIF
jgi:hypothetical protein